MGTITVQNNENFARWVRDLETTDAPQVTGSLREETGYDGGPGYCCLGRGCVIAGEELGIRWDASNRVFATAQDLYTNTLPPVEWLQWVGVQVDTKYVATALGTGTPLIDWPEDLHSPDCLACGYNMADPAVGGCSPDGMGNTDHDGWLYTEDEKTRDAAALNDGAELTFRQIADVLRYFGVKDTL